LTTFYYHTDLDLHPHKIGPTMATQLYFLFKNSIVYLQRGINRPSIYNYFLPRTIIHNYMQVNYLNQIYHAMSFYLGTTLHSSRQKSLLALGSGVPFVHLVPRWPTSPPSLYAPPAWRAWSPRRAAPPTN